MTLNDFAQQQTPNRRRVFPPGTNPVLADYLDPTVQIPADQTQAEHQALATGRPTLSSYATKDRSFATRPIPQRPEPVAPTLRDFAQEGKQGLNSAIVAGAFGLGLGGPGTAPRLADYALRGSRAGSEQAAQQAQEQVDAQNTRNLSSYRDQLDQFDRGIRLQQLDAQAQRQQSQDELDTRQEQRLAQDAQARLDQGATRQTELEASRLGDDRRALFTSLSGLDENSLQSALDLLESAGELNRLGVQIPRGEDGRWAISMRKALPASMTPEVIAAKGEATAARDRQKYLQQAASQTVGLFSGLIRDPRTNPKAAAELRRRIDTIHDLTAKGEPIPGWIYEISPESIASMTPAQKESIRQRDEALAQGGVRLEQGAQRVQQGQQRIDLAAAARAAKDPVTQRSLWVDAWRESAQAAEALGREIAPLRAQLKGLDPNDPQAIPLRKQIQEKEIEYSRLRRDASVADSARQRLETLHPELRLSTKVAPGGVGAFVPPSRKLPRTVKSKTGRVFQVED